MSKTLKLRIISALWFLFSFFPFALGGYSYQAIRNDNPFLFLVLFISSLLSIIFSATMLLIAQQENEKSKIVRTGRRNEPRH